MVKYEPSVPLQEKSIPRVRAVIQKRAAFFCMAILSLSLKENQSGIEYKL